MQEQDTITRRIRNAVVTTGTSMELALKIGEKRGWHGTPEQWRSRVDHMLSDAMPLRQYHADDIPEAIEVTGDFSILAPAHAAVVRVQARELEEYPTPGRAALARVAARQARAKRA